MKIAFDLDKTYEEAPRYFDAIAARFQVAGHSVGILSGRQLREGMEISFTPDFVIFLECGEMSYAERARMKAERMRKEKIDIIFDDRSNYFPSDIVALNIL